MSDQLLSEAYGGALDPANQPRFVWQDVLAKGLSINNQGQAVVSLHQEPDHLSSLTSGAPKTATPGNQAYLSWSYAQLNRAADTVLALLTAHNVRAGDKVLMFVYSCVEWPIMLWASMKLGAVFVPLDPSILKRKEELRYLFEMLQPAVVVVQEDTAPQCIDNDEHASKLLVKMTIGLDMKQSTSGWVKMADSPRYVSTQSGSPEPVATLKEDDPAAILFTSGTTGKPKGCPHSQRSLSALALMPMPRKVTSKSRFLANSMPFRAIYLFISIQYFVAGATMVLPSPAFSASTTLHALQAESATDFIAVPSQTNAFANVEYVPPASPTLQLSLTADFVTASSVSKAQSKLNPAFIKHLFGMSEGAAAFTGGTAWPPPPSENLAAPSTIIPIGMPAPGHYARICAPDSIEPLRRGESGELHVSGRCLVSSYYPASVSERSFYTDALGRCWFRTGDQAVMSGEGIITVLGRYKDVITRAGVELSPTSIELCIAAHPAVKSVRVVGGPSKKSGSVPLAVVELTSDADGISERKEWMGLVEELKRRVIEGIGEGSTPERVFTLKELGWSEWPVNASGKVVREDVMQRIRESIGWREEAN
ncbi:MAG: hypothetical protein Q9227_005800 [Pyrenula ochraceoflavens]